MATKKKTAPAAEKEIEAGSAERYKFKEYVETGCIGFDLAISGGKGLPVGASILLFALPGCVDKDTEYFNGTEWKYIKDYKEGEQVLQYLPETDTAELTTPTDYIVAPCDSFYHIKTKYGLDQMLSDGHNMAYFVPGRKEIIHKKKVSEIMERHNKNKKGFTGLIKTAFNYSGTGINLTDNEIKLMLAVCADGYLIEGWCHVQLKKERKIERLTELLNEMNMHYTTSTDHGYTRFRFKPPIYTKEFPTEWYNMSNKQLQVVRDNVGFWDGHHNNPNVRFTSTSKNNIDFVQFAFTANNQRAHISVDNREYKDGKKCYTVLVSNKVKVSFGHSGYEKREIPSVPSTDGLMYCFTVPSSYLILRRNGNIFVTGNCGKSTMICDMLYRLLRRFQGQNLPYRVHYIDSENSLSLLTCIGKETEDPENLGLEEFITVYENEDDAVYKPQQLIYHPNVNTFEYVENLYTQITEKRNEKFNKDIKIIVVDSLTNLMSKTLIEADVSKADFGSDAKERIRLYKKWFAPLRELGITSIFTSQVRQKQGATAYEDPNRPAVTDGDKHNMDIIAKLKKIENSQRAELKKIKQKTIDGEIEWQDRYIINIDTAKDKNTKNRVGRFPDVEIMVKHGRRIINVFTLYNMLVAHGYIKLQNKNTGHFTQEFINFMEAEGFDETDGPAKAMRIFVRQNMGKTKEFLRLNGKYTSIVGTVEETDDGFN